MKLDETQQRKVAGWIEEGLKIAEIQKRLESEFGLRMTYLDVRLLVDELKLMPKDPVVAEPPVKPAPLEPAETPANPDVEPEQEQLPKTGGVRVSVDQLTRPGAVASGKVTFSDGKTVDWFLDEMGRLALAGAEKGYKPSAADVQDFQMELQKELQKLGF